MRKVSYLLLLAVVAFSACQESFKKGEEGLEYKIISKDKNAAKIEYGNFMQIHISQFYNDGKKDSLLSDSRTTMPGFEVLDSMSVPPAYFKILSQVRKGDSVVIRVMTDSAFKKNPQGIPPPFMKGHYLTTTVKVIDIYKTREQADAARSQAMVEGEKKQKALSEEQLVKDDKMIAEYLKKNNITATKGAQGTYVQIITPGVGPNADTSNVVKVYYTGKTLAGKRFDSNNDAEARSHEPLVVNLTNDPSLGQPLIGGFNDGMVLLNKGAKAKFYIPSSLGYGAQGAGADIAPNSILVFDIDVLDVLNKSQAKALAAEQAKKMQAMQKHYMDSIQKAQPRMDTTGK
ncbi:MAG: Peptidylprolyl isomerase [Ferruginibacter sp.]|nr:Peptidylprolyl isomerase [Ferruginibacter sp.]